MKKYSNKLQAKISRIRRLPVYLARVAKTHSKRDAMLLIQKFHDGIKEETLELWPLADSTVRKKELQGFEQPDTPLYGLGDEDKSFSYLNMLRIVEETNGYRVKPSKAMHWSGKLRLSELFNIHEFGCTIQTTRVIIRIPPRPAFKNAYQKMMKELSKNKKETSRTVKKAVREYINKADSSYFETWIKNIESRLERDFKRLSE